MTVKLSYPLYFLFSFLTILLLGSCRKSRLDMALEAAGENRAELEKVLTHYSVDPSDSLKLKAAVFLIENMPFHFTMKGEVLSNYYRDIDSINRCNHSASVCKQKYDSLKALYGDPRKGIKVISDLHSVKADYLINNIDLAYASWQDGFWARHLSFDEFCEYILPYRYGTENLTDWRAPFQEKYRHRIEWLDNEDPIRNSSYWAALYMNDQLKQKGFWLEDMFDSPVDYPATLLENMRMGSCVNYAQSAVAVMRACGIPVAIDFTPQWPFRSMNHTWNVVLDNNGLDIPFMGSESNPGYPNKPAHTMAKAFRYMYAYQEGSLFDLKGEEEVPSPFNSPFIKDVSSHYFRGTDVEIKVDGERNPEKRKFAYLAVFDNQNWIPIQWGRIGWWGRVKFPQMGRNVVYLPVYYKDKKVIPAGDPFLLHYSGQCIPLKVDRDSTQRMVLRRKFPVFGGVLWYSGRLVNGVIEGANRADFRDAVPLARITRNPLMHYDTVCNNRPQEMFRYYRYCSPKGGYCNIAELEFMSGKKKLLEGMILTNEEYPASEGNGEANAFDGDGLTYYETQSDSCGWVGMDFGRKVRVDYFRYLPRNDDNNVSPGNDYELMVWENGEWRRVAAQRAVNDSLVFKNVPAKGLFLLKNRTRGREERIFTYEKGKQKWW